METKNYLGISPYLYNHIKMAILKYIATLACIAYLSFSYTEKAEEFVDLWLLFILRCICLIIETTIIYRELYDKYRMVLYDDSDYTPTNCQVISLFIFNVLFYFLLVSIITISALFFPNITNPAGTMLFQIISLLILLEIIVMYVRGGLSDYSGDAFCEMLDSKNSVLSKRSLLPSSLCEDEMRIYEESFCLMRNEANTSSFSLSLSPSPSLASTLTTREPTIQ